MKRFYTEASRVLDAATGMHAILLDGRPVRTPVRMALAVPGAALADAIVA
jgi:chaperone required for assembly of F1-ATPase